VSQYSNRNYLIDWFTRLGDEFILDEHEVNAALFWEYEQQATLAPETVFDDEDLYKEPPKEEILPDEDPVDLDDFWNIWSEDDE
jgi:hypothetical protein